MHLVCINPYDYGDGWEIRISMTNRGESIASNDPICWEGAGEAPPEDVGGEGGFEHFLKVMDDPDHDEHDHLKAWGEGQGFEWFSKHRTNDRLSRWREWERIEDDPPITFAAATAAAVSADSADDEAPIDPDDYDAAVAAIRKDNARYLGTFEKWLKDSGLSHATIRKHMENVSFYIDEYLNYYEPTPMRKGARMLDGFLGDWFIRKCMWSSASSIKSNATSIKKFYKCMAVFGYVAQEDYKELCDEIKQEMPSWQSALKAWDAGDFGMW